MTLILYGKSEIGAQVSNNLRYLICLRNFIDQEKSQITHGLDTSNLLIILYTGLFYVRELSLQSSFFKLILLYLPYIVYNILYDKKKKHF